MLAEQCYRRILWPGLLLVIALPLTRGTATGPADSTSTTTGTQSAPSNITITIVTPEGIGPNSDPITGPRARAPENSPAPGKVRLTGTAVLSRPGNFKTISIIVTEISDQVTV